MKKIMKPALVCFALAITAVAHAYTPSETNQIRLAEKYLTNDAVRAESFKIDFRSVTNAALLAEIDTILAAKPPLFIYSRGGKLRRRQRFPKTFAAADTYYASTFPFIVRRNMGKWSPKKATKAEMAEYYIEQFVVSSSAKDWREKTGKALGSLIVPTLRKQGKAITTGPDGKSPIKEYAARISAALEAPRLAGLAEILTELGVKTTLHTEYLPSDEKVAAMKAAVFSGDRPFTRGVECILNFALGVAAYNEFVAAYNGGTR